MFLRTRKRYRIAAMVPAVLVAAMTQAADVESQEDVTAYEMAAYSDGPGSEALFDGRYRSAIAAATSFRAATREESLRATANLCVAYTLSGDFGAAEHACSRAAGLARDVDVVPGKLVRRRTETAKALTNLGVLKALSGDIEAAASQLRRAVRMNAWAGADRNLAHLEVAAEEAPQLASASD